MKFIVFIGLMLSVLYVSAQDIDPVEAKAFWGSNVQNILEKNKNTVADQTHFPLNTFLGKMSRTEFLENFGDLFSEDALKDLSRQGPIDIQPVEYEPGVITYMIVTILETEVDGEIMESAVVLSFKKYDNAWKLYSVDIAG